MFQPIRVLLGAAMVVIGLSAGAVFAADPGQEELDKATAAKTSAETVNDLDQVVELIELAMHKGLGKANTAFAKQLLSSALFLRAKTLVDHMHDQGVQVEELQRRCRSALRDLNRSTRLNPNQPRAYLMIAELKALDGNAELKEMIETLDQAVATGREENDAEIKEVLIRALLMRASLQESPKKAADDLDEADAEQKNLLHLDPKNIQWLLQLAVIQTTRKKSADAVKTYSDVLAIMPNEWHALLGRGDAYLNLGRHAEAIADYESTWKLQPKNPNLLNNFAWVLATSPDATLRDGARAMKMATDICEATQYRYPHLLSTLAAACAETGDFESAVKWATKAVELGGKDKEDGESLQKELDSYKAKKPIRERLSEEPAKQK